MSKEPNVKIVLKKDDPIERALRKFKRLVERAGITKQVRAKRHYEKPSDQRRRELRKQERNRRRAERKTKERTARKMERARKKQRIGAMAHSGPSPEPMRPATPPPSAPTATTPAEAAAPEPATSER